MSDLPLYQQIRNHIISRIESGEFKPGHRLPTQNEFKEEYNVSTATIRHALDDLERKGIIHRQPRIGTILNPQGIRPEFMKLQGFNQMMISKGLKPNVKVQLLEVGKTPQRVRDLFRDQEIINSWHVVRLLLADGQPIGLQDLYIHPRFQFSPDDIIGMTSFYKLINKLHNVTPTSSEEIISACLADKQEAEILGISSAEPLLSIWKCVYDEAGLAFEVCHIRYIASRYEYEVQLVP